MRLLKWLTALTLGVLVVGTVLVLKAPVPPTPHSINIDEGLVQLFANIGPGPRMKPVLGKPVIWNQIDESIIPQAPIIAAAASWGLEYHYGGAPACEHSPEGVQVICTHEYVAGDCPSTCLSGWFLDGSGIVLFPGVFDSSRWKGVDFLTLIQYLVCHEEGNAQGYEEKYGLHNCMNRGDHVYTNALPQKVS